MDKVTNLKESLCLKIQNSNDVDFLEAIQGLLDKESYVLSKEQNDSINQGILDIKNGDFKSQDLLMSETKEWLRNE